MKKSLSNIKIDKIGYGGVGLARRQDGKRILIKGGALPGSVVDLKIVKEKKDFIEAHITKIIKTDPKIVDGEVFCPHFFCSTAPAKRGCENNQATRDSQLEISPLGRRGVGGEGNPATVGCGGCKWQQLNYITQLKLKEDIVREAFEKIMKQNNNIQFLPIVGSPQDLGPAKLGRGYRNKIEFSFGKYITNDYSSPDPRTAAVITLSNRSVGFHKQGEFSKIIDIENCGLISDKANEIFAYIKKLCFKSGLPVYDQKTHQGFFRHLVIREGTNTQQFLVNLSVADNNLPSQKERGGGGGNQKREKLLEKLKKDKFLKETVDTLVITYNNELGDTIKNDKSETKTFRGEGHIYEKLIFKNDETEPRDSSLVTSNSHEVTFRVSPFSFFQTNTLGAQQLFAQAMKLTGNVEGDILDLYCGTGSIGLSFLKQGKGEKLLGIEIVEEAITDARHNAKINGLEERVNFLAAPAEKAFMTNPELRNKVPNLGLVIIDPPRDGLHKNTITLISQLKKEADFKLLYISCNPITIKRDVELFIEQGFTLKTIQPVDMFPQTHHIETIGILQ